MDDLMDKGLIPPDTPSHTEVDGVGLGVIEAGGVGPSLTRGINDRLVGELDRHIIHELAEVAEHILQGPASLD